MQALNIQKAVFFQTIHDAKEEIPLYILLKFYEVDIASCIYNK